MILISAHSMCIREKGTVSIPNRMEISSNGGAAAVYDELSLAGLDFAASAILPWLDSFLVHGDKQNQLMKL